jgi:hypothetical protein
VAAAQDAQAWLYTPPAAVRVDNDGFLGTPLPPEEPQADNPPSGAVVDYYLRGDAAKVTLQILDAQGHVLRHFSSADQQTIQRPLLPIAERWFPKPQVLETSAGEHRFVWDLAAGGSGTGLDDDDDDDSSAMPPGPKVPPGVYTLRLSVDGKTLDRSLHVTMDPRTSATGAVLTQQYTLASPIYAQTLSSRKAMAELESVESQLKNLASGSESEPVDLAQAIRNAQARLEAIKGGDSDADEEKSGEAEAGLASANSGLGVALHVVESGDRTAPAQALAIFSEMSRAAHEKIEAWQHFKTSGLAEVNAALVRAHREPLQIAAIEEQVHYAMTR